MIVHYEWSKEEIYRAFAFKPLRTCRKYREECWLCWESIKPGQRYYDRGFGRIAHEMCVKGLRESDEHLP